MTTTKDNTTNILQHYLSLVIGHKSKPPPQSHVVKAGRQPRLRRRHERELLRRRQAEDLLHVQILRLHPVRMLPPEPMQKIRQARLNPWFKVAVSVIDSDGPETYRSRCIGRVSADTQNEMNKIFKNY